MKYIITSIVCMLLLFACSSKDSKDQNTSSSKSDIKKVLFVLTSHGKLGDTNEKTGFWIEEFATPYYYLKDKGVQITLASPKGGQPPFDPRSNAPEAQAESTKRFNNDKETQTLMKNTVKLSTVKAEDYDAVFYPGGHGPLWDLAEDKHSVALIKAFYMQEKPVAAVCHAPAVFKNVRLNNGEYIVRGKNVTGFSDDEEKAIELMDIVPFSVERMLKENGAVYSKLEMWQPYALEDDLLITGQNPASSEKVAEMLYKKL